MQASPEQMHANSSSPPELSNHFLTKRFSPMHKLNWMHFTPLLVMHESSLQMQA
jgi:hypothetical protein